MAKMKNKKNNMTSRGQLESGRGSKEEFGTDQYDAGEDMDGEADETEEANYQAAGSRQSSSSRQNEKGDDSASTREFDPSQLLDSAREFIEGHPGRATLIGAAVGGVLAGLFATERGRQLVSAAYSYSRPMIADYARNFINSQSGDAIERALPQ